MWPATCQPDNDHAAYHLTVGKPLAEVSARVAARTRAWPLGHWYWGDAIAIDGLLAVAHVDRAAIETHLLEVLGGWLRSVPPGYHDALAPGAAIAQLVAKGMLPEAAADRFLRALDQLPILCGSVPVLEPHLPQYRFGLCIDAVYHVPSALAAIGAYRDDARLLTRAVTVATEMLARLTCAEGWAHWYDVGRGCNNAIPWSRGLGWALLGVLDTVKWTRDRVNSDLLVDLAKQIQAALAASQEETGHLGPVLGRHDLLPESSVAAFFVAAALHPEATWPSDGSGLVAAQGALLQSLGADGTYRGVSADVLPTWDPVRYERFDVEPSPWGQGAALRALAAMMAVKASPSADL